MACATGSAAAASSARAERRFFTYGHHVARRVKKCSPGQEGPHFRRSGQSVHCSRIVTIMGANMKDSAGGGLFEYVLTHYR